MGQRVEIFGARYEEFTVLKLIAENLMWPWAFASGKQRPMVPTQICASKILTLVNV